MPGVQRITGRAVAINRANIDTDQIIPASWLKRVERTGFEAGLFGAWRDDPAFPLNRPGAAGAKILVAGDNFGCGSSREHAVWALQDFGFAAVISPGFADIFRGNAVSSGLVPAQVPAEAVARVFAALAEDPDAEVVVDVTGRTIAVPSAGVTAPFELADFARWRLMEGLDDVALTLRHAGAIADFEAGRLAWLPAQQAPAGAPAGG
jgi:3-isopropylmalate/(R)-2-methylmalate dehydratase small subunit